MKKNAAIALLLLLCGCTELRVKKYSSILDPMLGTAKKTEVNKLLGVPTTCAPEGVFEKCEYRTASARNRNEPVPDAYRKQVAMGPDLSPYDHFDVLQVQYDGMGIFKDWQPVVIK